MGWDVPSPLPPPPLTVRPQGLLDFLSIQAGGRYPQHLGENLQPTIDLLNWYIDAQAETVTSGNIAQTSAGSANVGFTVPAGEAWLVAGYSVYGLVPALMTKFADAICVFDTDGVTVRTIIAASPTTYIAAEQMAWSWRSQWPDLWLPGTPIGLVCITAAGAAGFTPTLRLRIVRCTV